MSEPIRIGNAQGFWGDRPDAAARLLEGQPDLDYLTLDYLAEVSLSILAMQRERGRSGGYAPDFVEVVRSLADFWRRGSKVRVVSNAGGLDPHACAQACLAVLGQAGCPGIRIGVVSGDDVLPQIRARPEHESFRNLETGRPATDILDAMVTANAYLGAEPVAQALRRGAQIVITGRLADPSLVTGPCLAHFGWASTDHDRLAGATIAGHLIECGAQVTGGISTDWLDVPDPADLAFPIVEVFEDGSCVVTKPPGTGGRVTERTVKEQLLYEIGDPTSYLSPDATVSFLSLEVAEVGQNRVRVRGAQGRPPSGSYKVSATYRAGFRAAGTLAIFGRQAVRKARRAGEALLERLKRLGLRPERCLIECLGAGDVVPIGVAGVAADELLETVLRISVADARREPIERFSRELASLVTAGPQGTTGYAEGRPRVHPVFGYWPCLVDRSLVTPTVELLPLADG